MFECSYCHKTYVNEDRFLKHKCKTMERVEAQNTIIGQTAYKQYCLWMKLYKRNKPKLETFLQSKFYGTFIKFAEYTIQMKLPDVEAFIQLMIEKDFSPYLWMNDKVYNLYLERLDRKSTPIKQASITCNTLINLADDNNVDVKDVFSVLTINEVMQLIRERKLSPWILLASTKFKQLVLRSTLEEQKILEDLIRPIYWKVKFSNNPDTVKTMKQLVAEMGI